MSRLTDALLRTLRWKDADQWLSDGGSRGTGRLLAKLSKEGIKFYYQYFNSDKQRRFLSIGKYDAKGERGITLKQARDQVSKLAARANAGETDFHERIEAERQAEALARRAAKEAAERAAHAATQSTLRQMLDAYLSTWRAAESRP